MSNVIIGQILAISLMFSVRATYSLLYFICKFIFLLPNNTYIHKSLQNISKEVIFFLGQQSEVFHQRIWIYGGLIGLRIAPVEDNFGKSYSFCFNFNYLPIVFLFFSMRGCP